MYMSKEERIRRIREVGESLIKNAESIVGDEMYPTSLYISAEITSDDHPVSISVTKEFVPEKFMERMKN